MPIENAPFGEPSARRHWEIEAYVIQIFHDVIQEVTVVAEPSLFSMLPVISAASIPSLLLAPLARGGGRLVEWSGETGEPASRPRVGGVGEAGLVGGTEGFSGSGAGRVRDRLLVGA